MQLDQAKALPIYTCQATSNGKLFLTVLVAASPPLLSCPLLSSACSHYSPRAAHFWEKVTVEEPTYKEVILLFKKKDGDQGKQQPDKGRLSIQRQAPSCGNGKADDDR